MKKHTTAADLPPTEQIARERSRLRYKRRYGRTLRSTAAQTAHMGRRALLRCRRRDRLCPDTPRPDHDAADLLRAGGAHARRELL